MKRISVNTILNNSAKNDENFNVIQYQSYDSSIATDGLGNPAVTWNDTTSGNAEIYIKKWNGTSCHLISRCTTRLSGGR